MRAVDKPLVQNMLMIVLPLIIRIKTINRYESALTCAWTRFRTWRAMRYRCLFSDVRNIARAKSVSTTVDPGSRWKRIRRSCTLYSICKYRSMGTKRVEIPVKRWKWIKTSESAYDGWSRYYGFCIELLTACGSFSGSKIPQVVFMIRKTVISIG